MDNQSNDKNGPTSSWATSTADPQMPILMPMQKNDKNGPTSSWASSTDDPQMPILMPMQKMPITPKPVIFLIYK
jgi:hypothetical protein